MTSVGHLDPADGRSEIGSPTGVGSTSVPFQADSSGLAQIPCGADGPSVIVRKDVVRNRARILAAADQLVADRGLDISFNELARRAGVGVGTVYRHFADRQAVIDAMLESRLDQVAQILREADTIADSGEAFKAAIRGVIGLLSRDRGVLACVTPDEKTDEQQALVRNQLKPLLDRIVDRAHRDGWLRADVETTDIPVIFMFIDTLGSHTEQTSPDLWQRYLDLMLDGMCTPRPSPLTGAAPTVETLEEMGRHKSHRSHVPVETTN